MSFTPIANPSLTIPLQKPIQYLGTTLDTLAMREPTAGDVLRVGNPVKIKSYDPLELDFDEAKSFKMLERLSGVMIEGSLDRMTSNDAVAAMYAIAPFFIPGFSTKQAEQSENSQENTAAT